MANEKRTVSVKLLVALMSSVLVLGCVIGGTFAWLIDKTDPVVNTFTYGDINIGLSETTGTEYEMLPGRELEKNPLVTVMKGSEDSWIFVQLTKSDNYDKFLEEYTMADGWTQLKEADADVEGVYFCMVESPEDADVELQVLKEDQIVVKEDVTKADLNALDDDPANPQYPTLTVQAFAIQYESFEPALTDGAVEPTEMELNDAALKAWKAIGEQLDTP